MSAQAYLLAAGRGRRAGGPKAWLEHEGKPLLERQLAFLLERFAARDVAVSVQAPWLKRCRRLNARVRWTAVDPDASPLASLQALLKAMPCERPAFVYHVDMPLWESGLFDALERAARRDKSAAVVPLFQGKRGHPVLLSPAAAAGVAALDPAADRLDAWLCGQQVPGVEVPYPCAVANWNGGPPWTT